MYPAQFQDIAHAITRSTAWFVPFLFTQQNHLIAGSMPKGMGGQIAAMHTQIDATKHCQLLPACFPPASPTQKQISDRRNLHNALKLLRKYGGGEGI